jgi:hypothetical protein
VKGFTDKEIKYIVEAKLMGGNVIWLTVRFKHHRSDTTIEIPTDHAHQLIGHLEEQMNLWRQQL